MSRARRIAVDAVVALVLASVPFCAVRAGQRGPASVTLNLGPNDGAYVSGFAPRPEIEAGVGLHWSLAAATIDLPLWIDGRGAEAARLSYRFARVLPEAAEVRLSVGGRVVDRVVCRGGAVQLRTVPLAPLRPREAARVSIDVDSHAPRDLGLRMDWLSLSVGEGGRLRLRGAAAWRPIVAVVLLVLLFRLVGLSTWVAAALTMPWALGLAWWAHSDPLALAHVTGKLTYAGPIVLGLVAAFLARRPLGRWVFVLFVFSYLLKGAGLFHPRVFYPDVETHRRFAFELAESTGSIADRGREAQRALHQAYRTLGNGRGYNFPYSPLFYVPFLALVAQESEVVEDAMRHVGLVAAAAEVPLVFWLAALLLSPTAGLGAAVVAAAAPVLFSRLLYAMWPTLLGHVFDLLVIAAAARYVLAPSRRRLAWLGVAALGACLVYVSSLFNVPLLLAGLALLERRHLRPLLAVAVLAPALAISVLYAPFVAVFVSEIAPLLAAGGAVGDGSGSVGAWAALARVPMFWGWALPLLTLAGLGLAWRRVAGPRFHVLAAGLGAFGVLLALRALGGGLFKDLKETTFVAPFVALLTGAVLEVLAQRGRRARLAAILVALGLLAFGLGHYGRYLETYPASSVACARDAPGAACPSVLGGASRNVR